MAASIETQRLISVSLGKIAQSRGQRGGINLHKNLLVATVLHKARTAYMMESYGYQQSLQRQKLQEQQQQQVQPPVQTVISTPVNVADKAEEVCQGSHDSNLGQLAATPGSSVESGSESSTVSVQEPVAPEPMSVHEVESEVAQDKENSPPVSADRFISLENVSSLKAPSSDDHLIAATQLSQEAQSASSDFTSVKQQQNLTSAAPTCNNVLKRRRDNPTTGSQDYECPVSKKARVSLESSSYTSFTDYSSDFSDISSDESDSESESEIMQTDSPQITNLVSIFNSGFSGLCAVSQQDSDLTSSDFQSDSDISNSASQLSSSLSKLRPESPSPAYSRKMSEPSLLCSSQVGRLESLPSAILLSA